MTKEIPLITRTEESNGLIKTVDLTEPDDIQNSCDVHKLVLSDFSKSNIVKYIFGKQ